MTIEAESEGATAECAPLWSIVTYQFPQRGDDPHFEAIAARHPRIDVGLIPSTAAQRLCCDTDGSGFISALDVLDLAQKAGAQGI